MTTTRKRSRRPSASSSSKVASLNTERMKLADLNPHPRNPEIRKHPEPGSPKWVTLSKSLEHDYFDPIVWNSRSGFLVSGHLRLKVMLADGFDEADVVVVDYDEPTHIARMLAANRGLGDDDEEGQKKFFEEIHEAGLSLDLTGFDSAALEDMKFTLPGDEEEGGSFADLPSAVEEVLEELVGGDYAVERGEHWRAGPHHIFCVPVANGPREWVGHLQEGTLLLIRPGIYSLTDPSAPTVCLEPDPLLASMLLSNYARVHGAGEVHKLEDEG